MFSSILNTVESLVESWQNSSDTQNSHRFSEGVWIHDLPGAEAGVSYNRPRTQPQINLEQANERDVTLDRHQKLAQQDVVRILQLQIAEMERREKSARSALDLTRQQLSERNERLQMMTNEINSKNVEIEQKQCTLYEYENKLRMGYDVIRKLEAKSQKADLTVKSLERELGERKVSMAQMETKEQSSWLALESLYKQLLQIEKQLRSSADDVDNFERQKMCGLGDVKDRVTPVSSQTGSVEARESNRELQIGDQTESILDENVRLWEQGHSLSCSLEEVTGKAAEMDEIDEDLKRFS